MTERKTTHSPSADGGESSQSRQELRRDDALERLLARTESAANAHVIRDLSRGAQALDERTYDHLAEVDSMVLEREERSALRRVVGLSTELEDVTEVEYRQLRLEKVILIGVYSGSSKEHEEAENSLRELAALADTAGAQVLDGLLQRRSFPDPATFWAKARLQNWLIS